MRIFARATPSSAWRLLSPGSLKCVDAEALLQSLEQHVATDGKVHGLCVDFENTRVLISDARELYIVAKLAAAYNNSLTAQHLQHETDLYGDTYANTSDKCVPARAPAHAPSDVVPPAGSDDPFTYVQSKRRTPRTKDGSGAQKAQKAAEAHSEGRDAGRKQVPKAWDAELMGDQFIYDPTYEQNEELLPWNVRDTEERYGWYM